MNQARIAAWGAFTFILAMAASGANAQPADPAVYGALPSVSEAAISPDGKTVALLQHAGAMSAVLFYNVDNPGSKPPGVSIGETNARGIVWADNDKLLLLMSSSSRVPTTDGLVTIEFFRWASVSKSTLKPRLLFENEPGTYMASSGAVVALPQENDESATFARYTRDTHQYTKLKDPSGLGGKAGYGYSLFAVDLETGKIRLKTPAEDYTIDWVVDEKGVAVARVEYDPSEKRRKIITLRDGKASVIADLPEQPGDDAAIWLEGLLDKPLVAAATLEGPSGRTMLAEYDLNTGSFGATLFSHPVYDVGAVLYDLKQARVTGVRYVDDLPRSFHFNPADQKLQEKLRGAIPGSAPMITSRSSDGQKMIVEVLYTDHPSQFFLYDKMKGSLSMIAMSYPSLDGKVAAKKERYDYTTPDGLTIEGYLTVPRGASKKNMPLIVLPHGGPEGRDDMAFGWWEFFYAARGYLVYQPNFRGSDGYGYGFRSAGYGEWGRKMQDDITNGVKSLIADGAVDPERICIVGGSYGGYAALAGATLTPDLYACAVSVNGVSNLPGMLGQRARVSDLAEDYWEKRIGSRFRDEAALEAVSPADNAARAGAPILLIHSKHDVVVPVSQSKLMRAKLEDAHKPHEYVELNGEDHWLSSAAMRTEMLARSIAFIDKYIGK